jgi:Zn-dependent metalloprotease
MVRFIGTTPGHPIARPATLSANASSVETARAFLDRFGSAFGVSDEARELQVMDATTDTGARSTVRFQQVSGGVPVLAGEIVVNLDSRGDLLSVGGEVLPSPEISTTPLVRASEARQAARASVAKDAGVGLRHLKVSTATLWIYDSVLMGGPGLAVPTLVWRTEVRDGGAIDQLVLVDARLGSVALQFNQFETARNRRVCDAQNADTQVPCTSPVRTEGQAPVGNADVDGAYDYAGATYDFFKNTLGRDSLDGAGMTLNSTVRYCPTGYYCPWENAAWTGEQMVYGQGYASADDVVGHELTHGVTDYTSRLFYYYQSGAINESMSDVFGELIDLTDGMGTDTATTRWLLGEDLPIGAIRDMEDPPAYDQPDRMTSALYYGATSDNGGVHTNSGVNNKAAYLIVDGGTFNGQVVTSIGITKAAKIYYEVDAHLLTSAGDYSDLASALPQACNNLVGTSGITAADCTQVLHAVQAVEMSQVPSAAPAPEAPMCGPGQSATNLFFDDLENTGSGNWTKQTITGSNTWYYPMNPNPIVSDGPYATSGTKNFWGYDQSSMGDYSMAMTSGVAIPSGSSTFIRFAHAYLFEFGTNGFWDGGVFEYSTNGGASWLDAGSLPVDNGYSGVISASYGNPLGGRNAFTGSSRGYISSRFNLGALAGQNVRFRFRIGTDGSYDNWGWFVDDVRIYTCGSQVTNHTLTVSTTGAGTGTVTSNPAGINCGSTCSFQFTSGTPVTLSADAASGSTFDGWSGAGCSGAGTCQVVMNADVHVTAAFSQTEGPAPVKITSRVLGFYGTLGKYKLFHRHVKVRAIGHVSPNPGAEPLTYHLSNLRGGAWVEVQSADFTMTSGTVAIYWPKNAYPLGKYRISWSYDGNATYAPGVSPWTYFKVTR